MGENQSQYKSAHCRHPHSEWGSNTGKCNYQHRFFDCNLGKTPRCRMSVKPRLADQCVGSRSSRRSLLRRTLFRRTHIDFFPNHDHKEFLVSVGDKNAVIREREVLLVLADLRIPKRFANDKKLATNYQQTTTTKKNCKRGFNILQMDENPLYTHKWRNDLYAITSMVITYLAGL